MKSTFGATTSEEINARIDSLSQRNTALRDKMNALQMVKHCTFCEDLIQGKFIK